MKFRSRLLIAFLLFAIAISSFLFYGFSEVFKEKYSQEHLHQIDFQVIQKERELSSYLQQFKHHTVSLGSSVVVNSFLKTKKDEMVLEDLFFTILKSHEYISQIRLLDKNGLELVKIVTDNNNSIKVKKESLQNKSNRYYFKQIQKLHTGELWYSNMDLNKEYGKVQKPISPVIRVAQKLENGFLIINYSMKSFEKVLSGKDINFYLLDKDGEIIIDGTGKYSWSKYLNKDVKIDKFFTCSIKNKLSQVEYKCDKLFSKKLTFPNPDEAVVVTVYPKNIMDKLNQEMFIYYLFLFILVVILSIVLAIILSKPILKLSSKIEQQNKELDKKVAQKTQELQKSLNIIDKYVIRSATDLNGVITDVSQAFCNISGYAKDELLNKPHSIVRHPNMPKDLFQDMWETIQKGQSWEGIVENKTKDEKSYWVRAYLEPQFNDSGDIIGYTAIRNNITSEILLENQIKQNSAIINFANSAIGTIDKFGRFLSVNSVYTKLFGFTKEEFYQKSFLDLLHEKDRQFGKNVLEEAKNFNIVSHIEMTFRDKYNNNLSIEISLNKLPDDLSFVIVVNSLEDKKKLENINSSLKKQVEQEVSKNTQQMEEIQKEQLKHAKLNSIGLVAAGVIHEINTPLTYMKGNLEIFQYDIEDIKEKDVRERVSEGMENIFSGLLRIENIVKSMREITQVSSESKNVENIYDTLKTSLTVLYNSSKVISKVYLNGDLFDMDMRGEYELCYSNVQKQRLEQVWIVIASNALDELVKIDDYEKRQLEITIEPEDDNVVVRFKDNAGGISLKVIDTIFEPLVSTKKSGGLGIGLNVAKKIIDDQDGEILAYNEDNGAIFEVRLPLVKKGDM